MLLVALRRHTEVSIGEKTNQMTHVENKLKQNTPQRRYFGKGTLQCHCTPEYQLVKAK
jgi:hypothetical protein